MFISPLTLGERVTSLTPELFEKSVDEAERWGHIPGNFHGKAVHQCEGSMGFPPMGVWTDESEVSGVQTMSLRLELKPRHTS